MTATMTATTPTPLIAPAELSAFTPGPWRASFGDLTRVFPVGSQFPICGVHRIQKFGPAQVKANAHIIAAAPEMYEALKNLIVDYEPKEGSDARALAAAHAAIARAEGRTP